MNNQYKDPDYHKKYYQAHKVVKDDLAIHQLPTEPLIIRSNVQEIHINDFYSAQLARIENVLWWIAFAISFVGVAVLFK